jgi:hypothetical protein
LPFLLIPIAVVPGELRFLCRRLHDRCVRSSATATTGGREQKRRAEREHAHCGRRPTQSIRTSNPRRLTIEHMCPHALIAHGVCRRWLSRAGMRNADAVGSDPTRSDSARLNGPPLDAAVMRAWCGGHNVRCDRRAVAIPAGSASDDSIRRLSPTPILEPLPIARPPNSITSCASTDTRPCVVAIDHERCRGSGTASHFVTHQYLPQHAAAHSDARRLRRTVTLLTSSDARRLLRVCRGRDDQDRGGRAPSGGA